MHSCVTSKNVKWCHLIWPTLYAYTKMTLTRSLTVMSTIASHSPLNISETVEIEAWFQRPPIGNGLRGIKWSRDRWRHV